MAAATGSSGGGGAARRRGLADANTNTPPAKRTKTVLYDTRPKKGLEAAVLANGSAKQLTANLSNGIKTSKSHRIDEANAVITKPDGSGKPKLTRPRTRKTEAIEISSDSSSSDDSSDDDEDEDEEEEEDDDDDDEEEVNGGKQLSNGVSRQTQRQPNGIPKGTQVDTDTDEDNDDDLASENGGNEADGKTGTISKAVEDPDAMDTAEDAEPTFGELLQSQNLRHIDVEASFTNLDQDDSSLVPHTRRITAPSATSLGTVLTQALRTNDKDLLESCFEMNDLDSVRSTIERLPSPLAVTLLHKLAERMHKRPGRAGSLMVWVQWTFVAHGGYLAGQPDIVGKLSSLSRVIKERAYSLQPLLELKGKLDMLKAQFEMRRHRRDQSETNDQDVDDEADLIYVESDDDNQDSSTNSASDDELNDQNINQDGLGRIQEFDDNSSGESSEEDEGEEDDSNDDDKEASDHGFSDEEPESEEAEDDSDDDEDAPRTKHSLASRSGFGK